MAFPISGLRSVDLEVADLPAAIDFYTRVWGLALSDEAPGSAWLRGTGTDHHILALHRGPGSAIRSMTFRVADGGDPDAFARGIASLGGSEVAADADPAGGTVRAARDDRSRTYRFVAGDRRLSPLPDADDRPERLAHVNFNSDDVGRDTRLFTDALGFVQTDRSKMMAFVRTNDDHHSIVIAEAPVNTLNHVAFQLPGWESVMRASGRMIDHGLPIGWGPGRHGPGDNVFAYFVDPFGFVIEYTAEVLQVDDDYRVGTPADWIWPEGRTDQWGIAPPKSGACKAAQLAIPFTGQ